MEKWIWTELLAFDIEQDDYGVGAYLERTGFAPDGITFLLSAVDFILLHSGMETETTLFPDICSRIAHERNEDRHRQEWTNWKLKGLVDELHKHGVKVIFSIFNYYLDDRFHHEYATDHPEILIANKYHTPRYGFTLLARLDDGTLFEDFFISKMREVALDYGFDGWHGPDCQGPLGPLSIGDASDEMFFQFAEHVGKDKFPAEFLQPLNDSLEGLNRRMSFIWTFLKHEWADFNSLRWLSFWRKATEMMHGIGRETMINSPFTRSLFESLYYFGLDYREIDAMKVDYLLVESVATSVSVIDGKYERIFDYCSMLSELRALLPNMKFIMMEPVKDVVENWDAFRHAPARLERDTMLLASQFVQNGDVLRRSADGILYCLGDGILRDEWQRLNTLTETAFSFNPTSSGELEWLVESGSFDRLRKDHEKHGTWPPYFQVSHLVQNQGLDISCAVSADDFGNSSLPLLVPNFHLLSDELQDALAAIRGRTVILLGNFCGMEELAEKNPSVLQRMSSEYTQGCVVLNSSLPLTVRRLDKCDCCFESPDYWSIVEDRCPLMAIPEAFWKAAGELIRQALGKSELENPDDAAIHAATMSNGRKRRVFLYSDREGYGSAPFHFRSDIANLRKLNQFPYTDFVVQDGRLIMDNYNKAPVVVPPRGIVCIDVEER